MAHIWLADALTTSDYRKALEQATLAVQRSEKAGDPALQYQAYSKAGGLCAYKGLYDLAFSFYNRHYDLARKLGDEVESGNVYFNLSGLHLMLGNYAKAREGLREAERMLQQAYLDKGEKMPELTLLTFRMNLAICEQYLGEFRLCDSLLDLSLPMVEGRPGMEPQLQSLYHIRALMYLNSKRPQAALKQLESVRALAVQRQDLPALASLCLTEGESHEQTGDTAAAKRAYYEGLVHARQYNGLSTQIPFSKNLYKIYRKTGPPDSMAKYLELFTDLTEQSKSEAAKEALMRKDLTRAYEAMVEDYGKSQRALRLRYLYVTLSSLLVCLGCIAGVLHFRNRYRRLQLDRVQRDLEVRRTALEQQRLQAELGLRESELDRIRMELNRQTLIEGLVGDLDPDRATPEAQGSPTKGSSRPSASERRAKAWEEFEFRFQQMHSGFYDRLKQRFPDLTLNERRLCAFLKLDMTTKEISDITGQSVRAVNMARIRLRKKLGISHTDKELFAFLSEL
jgi:tetratricopeptide (TPR) repeat protein/DNA-binding CsgD family transcriptional regulator